MGNAALRRRIAVPGLALLLAACALRDPGHDVRPNGVVRSSELCPPADPTGCPVCSIPDGALCADLFYPGVFRCDDEHTCPGGRCDGGFCVFRDDDRNDLDDRLEREVARLNLPRLALHVDEACA